MVENAYQRVKNSQKHFELINILSVVLEVITIVALL